MLMNVFRIETPNGKGICASTGSPLCLLYQMKCHNECEHCSWKTLRNPAYWHSHNSKAEDLIRNGSFAFPSLKALENWFPSPSGRKLMKEAGARIVEFEVNSEDCLSTEFQCVFDKSKAKKIRELDLETLK